MKPSQINTQLSISLFLDQIFGLVSLFPYFISSSTKPLFLFVCRTIIAVIKFQYFLLLPKAQTQFNRRRDLLSNSRIQYVRQCILNLNFVSLLVSLKCAVEFQQFVLQKLMQYELIVLSPSTDGVFSLNIMLFIGVITFEQVILKQQAYFIIICFVLLVGAAFYQYFYIFKKIITQLQSSYNIDKIITKIFVNQPLERQNNVLDESMSEEYVDTQQIYVDFLLRSHDNYETKVSKYSQIFGIVDLLSKLFGAKLVRTSIDQGQIQFSSFCSIDLRHLVAFANTLEELVEQFGIDQCVIISKNPPLNERLIFEFDPGLFIINIREFQCNAEITEQRSAAQIQHIIQQIQEKANLQPTELNQYLLKVIALLPPQFEILDIQQYKYKDQAIEVAVLQSHDVMYNIMQIIVLKFAILSLDSQQKHDNLQDYELICSEINQQLFQLFQQVDSELEQALIFAKTDVVQREVLVKQQGSNSSVSSRSQLLTARHVPAKPLMIANSYMSKGEEYLEGQMKASVLKNNNAIRIAKAVLKTNIYFLDYSSYLEGQFKQHALMKPALIKARAQFKTFFYIPVYGVMFVPLYCYFLQYFKSALVYVYGYSMSYLNFLYIQAFQLALCSLLQLFVCYPIYSASQKVANNQSTLYNDYYVHIINVKNYRFYNHVGISSGRKFIFYIYHTVFMMVQLQFYIAIQSMRVGQQSTNWQHYQMLSTLPLFFNTIFNVFTSTISTMPEELLSLESFVYSFMTAVSIVYALVTRKLEFLQYILLMVGICAYHVFQLRDFVQYGKLQENNYQVLKQTNEKCRSKFDSFTLLVYNIIISKFVVLSTIIQSNYAIRRSVVINELQEDLSPKLTFYEKLAKYQQIMRDKQARQTCMITYPKVVVVQFNTSEKWTFDRQLSYSDYVNSVPQLYQLPLHCNNCCFFVESDEEQHLHNAFQIVLAFATGAMRAFKFQAAAITAGRLHVYFLADGKIHIHSEAIIQGGRIMPCSGIIASGELFRQYVAADRKFKHEIAQRIKQTEDALQRRMLSDLVVHLFVQYVNNGESVIVAIKQSSDGSDAARGRQGAREADGGTPDKAE